MEIYVGSTTPVKHKIYWRGEPTDATSNPIVNIYDVTEDPTAVPLINPTVPLYNNLSTEKDETDIGVYNVFMPPNATSKSRELMLEWNYNVSNASIVNKHKLFVVRPYVDLAEAVDLLGVGNDPGDPNYRSYNEISAAERYARKTIDNFVGQSFDISNEVYSVYGSDSDTLHLPSRITSLHKLYMNDQLLVDNLNNIDNWNYNIDFTESGFGIRINRASMADNTVYTANGMVPPSIHDGSGIFQNGVRYTVDASFGWEEVPDNVSLACIELMKDYFSKDYVWKNKHIAKISTFDWDFEYTSGAASGTGNLYADKLLEDYVVSKVLIL